MPGILTMAARSRTTLSRANAFYVKTDDIRNQNLVKQEIRETPGMQQYDVQTLV